MSEFNVGDSSVVEDDDNTKKQWEAIDDHMRQLKLFTDGINSPLSTSPAGQNNSANVPVVSRIQRIHNNPHNPLFRRSEGDIQGRSMQCNKPNNPPQSAPILHEGYEPNWEELPLHSVSKEAFSQLEKKMQQHAVDGISVNNDEKLNGQSIQTVTIDSRRNAGIYNNTDDAFVDECHRQDEIPTFIPSQDIHLPDANILKSYSNGGMNAFHHLPKTVEDTTTNQQSAQTTKDHYFQPHPVQSHNLHNQSPVINPVPPYKMSPSTRRKSAPVADVRYNSHSSMPRRAMSHSVQMSPSITTTSAMPLNDKENMFGSASVISNKLVEEDEMDSGKLLQKKGNYDDKEYTIALLQHQTDRMLRLRMEFEAKQKELSSLVSEVKVMEAEVFQRNTRYKSSSPVPTLQVDVGRLREINRKLQIDCNCMYKEVDLFSRDGDSTRDDFYKRYDRLRSTKSIKDGQRKPIRFPEVHPPPSSQEHDDEPKWRCSHCTFDNHSALNKCEMCEFPREVQSGRARLP